MKRYHVGDRVRIVLPERIKRLSNLRNNDLSTGVHTIVQDSSGRGTIGFWFTGSMLEFCGLAATITDVRNSRPYRYYKINLDLGDWNWVAEFFEEDFIERS